MNIISDLTPLNLIEEKEKFFADNSYNPRFIYNREFSKQELEHNGLPKEKLFNHSISMIDKYGIQPKNNQEPLAKEVITKMCFKLFTNLNIKPIPIFFSPSQISKAMINSDGLHFKYPVTITKRQLVMTLDHEIQTHLLRRINHKILEENNIIKSDRDEEKIKDFRITEEGIANLHSYVSVDNNIMIKTYTNYISAYISYHNSFSHSFHKMTELGISKHLAWNTVVKKKRGLTDTSQKGGYTKDIVYLEGAIKIWSWMQNNDNDPRDLYLGRIELSQINHYKKEYEKIRSAPQVLNTLRDTCAPQEKNDNNKMTYPIFFNNMNKYKENIKKIGEDNLFKELL